LIIRQTHPQLVQSSARCIPAAHPLSETVSLAEFRSLSKSQAVTYTSFNTCLLYIAHGDHCSVHLKIGLSPSATVARLTSKKTSSHRIVFFRKRSQRHCRYSTIPTIVGISWRARRSTKCYFSRSLIQTKLSLGVSTYSKRSEERANVKHTQSAHMLRLNFMEFPLQGREKALRLELWYSMKKQLSSKIM